MKKHKTKKIFRVSALSIVGLGFASAPAMAGISVFPAKTSDQLVESILGDGIELVSGSVKLNSGYDASGGFKNGNTSGLGIDTGIILTTGKIQNAVGANDIYTKTTVNGVPGDTDLDKLLPSDSVKTQDATTLEFKFTSNNSQLFFNYVFASEEYNEFVNSEYNDVFAFFLDGENIALIPGTDTPVAINTVNGGNPLGTGASNPDQYKNNEVDGGPSTYDIPYDGFTKVFQAQALNLTPGEHTIKLAIADTGDGVYDSAVFIQGDSFSSNPDSIATPEATPEPTYVPPSCTCFLALTVCNCTPTTPTPEATPVPTPSATPEPTPNADSIPEPTTATGLLVFAAACGRCLVSKGNKNPSEK